MNKNFLLIISLIAIVFAFLIAISSCDGSSLTSSSLTNISSSYISNLNSVIVSHGSNFKPLSINEIKKIATPLIEDGLKCYAMFNGDYEIVSFDMDDRKKIDNYSMTYTKVEIEGIETYDEIIQLVKSTFTNTIADITFMNLIINSEEAGPYFIEYDNMIYCNLCAGYGGKTYWMPETARVVEQKEDEILIEMDTKVLLADETYRYYDYWRVRLKKENGKWLIDSPLVSLGIKEGINKVLNS